MSFGYLAPIKKLVLVKEKFNCRDPQLVPSVPDAGLVLQFTVATQLNCIFTSKCTLFHENYLIITQ